MLTLLEHLNFKVPIANGESVIQDFFVSRLGCPECPTGRMRVSPPVKGPVTEGSPKQMHVNLGLSQIHFEWCTGDGREFTQPQRLEGFVTLQIANLGDLKSKMKDMAYTQSSNGSIVVMDPFGITTWVCEQANEQYMRDLARFGNVRPGGVGNVLGISRVDYNCQPGLSLSICNFYQDAFGAQCIKTTNGHAIRTRLGQEIAWNETLSGPPPTAYETNPGVWGIHMCFYIDKFQEVATKLENMFWVNPDYQIPPINDNVRTVQEACERRQFRLKHIGPQYVFEHEIRGMDHPLSPIKLLMSSPAKM